MIDRRPTDKMRYFARKGDIWSGKPILILVDETSENGAEIFAAAMQDRRRALVVGKPTKGLVMVQTVFPIARDHYLRITTSSVVRADGSAMRGVGVSPDVEWKADKVDGAALKTNADSMLEFALSLPPQSLQREAGKDEKRDTR